MHEQNLVEILKAYSFFRKYLVASILLLLLFLGACSPMRYLEKNQALVKKAKLVGIDKRYKEQVFAYVQRDIQPNSIFNLWLYSLVNSKERYRSGRTRNVGQAPHILDSALVEISRNQIEKYLETKGFLKAKVKSDIQIKNQRAYLTFTAERGPLYRIRNITYTIADTTVEKLYADNREKFSRLDSGKRLDRDSLRHEQEQIYQLLKRNGYYDYQREYVRFRADDTVDSNKVDLQLFLDNPEGKSEHKVYTINTTDILINRNNGKIGRRADSTVIDSQYRFTDYTRRFSPKALSQYIFLKKEAIYNLEKEELTYARLYDLNVFKNIKIDYSKTADSSGLNPRIETIPLKKMSNRIEGEYIFNSGRNGFNIGDIYTNRNLFGGAEQLEIKLRYGLLYDSQSNGGRLFKGLFNRDFQAGINVILPRLLVPFFRFTSGKNGLPRTTFSTSLQVFDQLGSFSNRIFINSMTYDWFESRFKQHSLTPVNIEYRNGRFNPKVKADLEANGFGLYVLTNGRSNFNLASQYAFTYNALKLSTYNNFLYFRGAADIGGNTLGLLSKTFNARKNTEGDRTILGLPYLQYAKTELDLRLYRSLGGQRQLVARINSGVGLPYGNSESLPFEKSFYAGGSSGIRAWQARTLGPGSYNRAVLDEERRKSLRNLDQLGEVKLEGNLEYRFKMLNNFLGATLRGATFVDAGNVWRIKSFAENPGGEFKFNTFLNQLAIGTGLGLRYDVDYFVFRLDVGMKLKDPQFATDPWVIRHFFNDKKTFQDSFKLTHSPDLYRFVQYNFGIGMPF